MKKNKDNKIIICHGGNKAGVDICWKCNKVTYLSYVIIPVCKDDMKNLLKYLALRPTNKEIHRKKAGSRLCWCGELMFFDKKKMSFVCPKNPK